MAHSTALAHRLAVAAAEEERAHAKLPPAEPTPSFHEFGPVALSVVCTLLGRDGSEHALAALQAEMRATALRVVRTHLHAHFCWWSTDPEYSLRRLRSRVTTILMSQQAAVAEVAIVGSTRACIGPGGNIVNLALGTDEVSRLYLVGLDLSDEATLWQLLAAKAGDPVAVEQILPDVAPNGGTAVMVQFRSVAHAIKVQRYLAVSPLRGRYVVPYLIVPTDVCTWGYEIRVTFPPEHQAAQTARILDQFGSTVLSIGSPVFTADAMFQAFYVLANLRTAMDIMAFVETAAIPGLRSTALRVTARTNKLLPWAAFHGLTPEIEVLTKTAADAGIVINALKTPHGVCFYMQANSRESADALRQAHVAVNDALTGLEQIMACSEYVHPDGADSPKLDLLFTRWGRMACHRIATLRNAVLESSMRSVLLYGSEAMRVAAADTLTELIEDKWPVDEDHARCRLQIAAADDVGNAGSALRMLLPVLEQHFSDCAIQLCPESLLITGPVPSIHSITWELKSLLGDGYFIGESEVDAEDPADDAEECPACLDPLTPSNSFMLVCSHRIHPSCFFDQMATNAGLELRCIQETCGVRIPWADVAAVAQCCQQTGLIETFARAKFGAFCLANTASFMACVGRDCRQIRHVPQDTFYCDQCNVEYCINCSTQLAEPTARSAHEGKETCDAVIARRRAARESAAFDVTQLGDVKPCPKCRANTTKNGGCNHMTCPVCRNHYCFICRASFGAAPECYAHLRAVHGGIYG